MSATNGSAPLPQTIRANPKNENGGNNAAP